MKKYIFLAVFLVFGLSPSMAFARAVHFDCSILSSGGGVSNSCVGSLVSLTNTAYRYDTNGTGSSYTFAGGSTEYIVADYVVTSGAVDIFLDNGQGLYPLVVSSSGTQAEYTIQADSGGTPAYLFLQGDTTGSNVTVNNICVSDTSYADCTGGGGGGSNSSVDYGSNVSAFAGGLVFFWFIVEAFTAIGVMLITSISLFVVVKGIAGLLRYFKV